MSRRKHVLQKVLQEEIEPPGDGQHIVRAVGSRGSNIIEASVLKEKHAKLSNACQLSISAIFRIYFDRLSLLQ